MSLFVMAVIPYEYTRAIKILTAFPLHLELRKSSRNEKALSPNPTFRALGLFRT